MIGLTSRRGWTCLPLMKRCLQWLVLTVGVCALPSCGLPGALGRTAGNTVSSVSGLVGAAAGH